jgi:Neprosin/Neprosin activation peptide
MAIESFSDFYRHLGSATHREYRTKRLAKVDSEESFEAQRQHLLRLYRDVEVQHSFVDAAGQIFDCIAIDQQPALKKSGRPLATPPPLPVRHAPASPRAPTLAPLHTDRRDRYGNTMACPEGTVAVRRVTLDEMTRFEDLEHFLRKSPRHTRKRSPQLFPPPDVPDVEDPPHEYAHAYQTVNNIGGHSTLSTWDPAITGDQIFSLSQHWYVATTDTGLVQTAEVGWQVFPQKYGHSKPVLFTYWTADDYTNTGSYSNDNGDFVQYSPTCPVGLVLEQVSAIGGAQAEIELSFILSDGNWWLYVNGADTADAVGYYPTALYQNGPLATGATEIDYGGETVGVSSYPPMGSGQFAAQGKGQAAYHRNIYFFPRGGGTQDADLEASQDWPQSYTIAVQSSNQWGKYFFFGGPGSPAPAAPVGALAAAAPPAPVSPRVAARRAPVTVALPDILQTFRKRANCISFEGITLPDRNVPGDTIVVVGESEFYSLRWVDIVDQEHLSENMVRVWARRGARAWRAKAIDIGGSTRTRELVVGVAPTVMAPGMPVQASAGDPPWLIKARSFIGTTWNTGPMPAIIKAWMQEIATQFREMAAECQMLEGMNYWEWCGGFVQAMLAYSNIRGPFGSAETEKWPWAFAWETWGTDASDNPQPGDVLVFKWAGGGGHVTFYDHEVDDDNYHFTGGDQGTSCTVSTEYASMSYCVAVRHPPAA